MTSTRWSRVMCRVLSCLSFGMCFIMLGAVGAMILVYMLAARLFPIINFWEQRELQLYDKGHVPYHRAHVRIMGKSE